LDALNHLLFAVLLVTPVGLSTYRLTAKMLACYAVTVSVGYVALGPSMNLVRLTDIIAYLLIVYIVYLAWVKKEPLLKLSVLCIATVAIAGASHGADRVLGLFMQVPPAGSPFRPHNLWHSPLFALALSAVAAWAVPRALNLLSGLAHNVRGMQLTKLSPRAIPLLAATYLGYLIHVFADSITYDFDVWWLFPLSDVHFSLYDLANAGRLLALDTANPWGWAFYRLTPALIVCASVFACLCYLARD